MCIQKKKPHKLEARPSFLMEAMDKLDKVSRVRLLIIPVSEVTCMLFALLVLVPSATASAVLPAAACSTLLTHHLGMEASAPAEISSESEDLLIFGDNDYY